MRFALSRPPGAERVVTPLELFFDLVYVFAISQLAHQLLDHLDLRGTAETAVLTLAVVYAWYMVAWGSNWLNPNRLPVRLLLVGLMFASLLMSAAIPGAFGDYAWMFVTGYLLVQFGRTVFLIVALRGGPLGRHFVNDLIWELAAGALWVAGAIADSDMRLILWAIAVVIAHTGLWVLHWLPGRGRAIDLDHAGVDGSHLVERFRLFFIIALGETVLTMGAAFAGEPFEPARLLALAIGFTATVALWWCYFQMPDELGFALAQNDEEAGRIGWIKTRMLTLMVLALIAIAVGDEIAIAHPDETATLGFTLLVFVGPALFLLAQIYFLYAARRIVDRSRLVALAALAILGLATAQLSTLAGIAAACAVLVAVAIRDTVVTTRTQPPAPRETASPFDAEPR
ncbi:low temperature requirement protein A [Microbacterium sp. NPDC019599]|uniref:low temperature requirement protein A n=1 Tax=Microbacterium sp. NPDC019599 TaxID=3154690 RepID=UPI0033DEAC66